MKKIGELVSDTLIYGISSVAARFINYILVPFHTDVFNPARYGIVGLMYGAIGFLNILFTFGMESAYLRYAKNREDARDVFRTLQSGLLVGATLLAGLLWLIKPWAMPLLSLDPQTESIYLMMIGILWFDTMAIVPFAELRLVRKSIQFSTLKVINVCINVGLNFYLILGLDFGLEAVFIANLAASVFTAIVLWIITAKLITGSFKYEHLKKALAFGLPFVPAGVGYAINEFIDRFFLNAMDQSTVTQLYGSGSSPESIVGIYNACYKLAVFMLLLIQMFRMAWQPFFLRHSDDAEAKSLFRTIFRYFNVVAATVFLVVALFAAEIVRIEIPVLNATIIGEQYWSGLHVVPFLLLAYWFQGWYVNFTAGVFIEEKTSVLPKITLFGAAITLFANTILVPYLGMRGSALATVISYASMALYLYIKVRKIYPVRYQMGRAGLMMLVSLAAIWWSFTAGYGVYAWSGKFLLLGMAVIVILLLGFSKTQLFIKNTE